MMTIKVIQHKIDADKVEQVGRPIIHLYECERLHYKFVDFKNREDFIEQYNKSVEGLSDVHILGIPDKYWKDKDKEKDIESNMFLCIYHSTGDNPSDKCMILQNATVYIMQGGQTVDKIDC